MMPKNQPAIRKVIIAVALLGILSTGAGGVETKTTHSQRNVVIVKETQSLEIIKAEINPNARLVRVTAKNVSSKNIDWFRISLGAGLDVEVDFAFADESVLAPGEVYEDAYPIDSNSNEVRLTVAKETGRALQLDQL